MKIALVTKCDNCLVVHSSYLYNIYKFNNKKIYDFPLVINSTPPWWNDSNMYHLWLDIDNTLTHQNIYIN